VEEGINIMDDEWQCGDEGMDNFLGNLIEEMARQGKRPVFSGSSMSFEPEYNPFLPYRGAKKPCPPGTFVAVALNTVPENVPTDEERRLEKNKAKRAKKKHDL
jgi:hypothetical protein